MTPPLPEMPRWDRLLRPPDKNSSSTPAHISFFRFPDKVCLLENSADADSSVKLLLPGSSPGNETKSVILLILSYPIPTHSKHNLIALLSTVTASPHQMPKHSMAVPAISNTTCAAVFFTQLIFSPFPFFCPYHSAGRLKSLLRTKI